MYGMEKCEAFYTSLKLLTYTNTIPYKNKKLQFAILYAATRLMCLITFIALPGVHVMKTITGKTGVDLSEDLSTMLGVTECILVTTLFISSYDKWSEFLTDLEHCNNFATPKAFDNTINKLNLYSLLYGSYSIVGCLIYAVIAIMKTPRCKKFNEEHNLNEICGSFTVLVLPFDFNNVSLVVRSVIFFVHMILGMFTLVTASVTIFVTYESAVILSCHFGELKKYLKEVFETESIEEQKQRLGFCIRYHNNILNLCMRRSHIVRYTHGIPLLSIPIILACIGNMLLNTFESKIQGLFFVSGYIVGLFLVCHGAQIIEDDALLISDALYELKWYEADVSILKDILFMLTRAQKPATSYAFLLGAINYHLFLLVLRTSYSYIMVFSQNV